MFRSASVVEAEAAQRKLDKLREDWQRTANTWFDGSAESVERRIAQIDRVIAFASRTAQRSGDPAKFCLAALPTLKANREELVELRRQLVGGSWYTGPEDHGFAVNPHDYSSMREWMDASNMRSYIQDAHEKHPQEGWDRAKGDYAVDESWMDPHGPMLNHAALDFIAEQDTTDPGELRIRAQRLVAARTSTWSREASARAVQAFVKAVEDNSPRPVRTASAPVRQLPDFEDHLMFS
ncbi:hypothetical protein SEA_YASSIFIED_74 [Mycobacterium phage Yassified]|uniref:Uncharacterized protein n=9 Tax=Bixzunavirus TaxID=680114 RepID=R4TK19_9CAUD|nr:hypothetical protein SCOTTMCG_74 [Mycobacterium phage ScottMcG]YP_002224331.1 gp77 [Mycobacterium phage Spud]YP_008061572.1 hypothetical protein M182_gp077 [Mycobacterium phage Astraea]YP_009204636.1 hypothetical protein HYRO_71 [Mycobacterium phage HyRo]YP_009216335.1 hypothetical protein ALICE_70 [Mycobacterium phage Alice]YP_656089.1 gp76 [Mycobacterium phage Catera]ALF51170.1 hypothetical protein SEA_ERNIEJ_74 [Mycobacterium phage ErnieJ]AXN53903.1 hypothetical protein SEA_RABINOVISH_